MKSEGSLQQRFLSEQSGAFTITHVSDREEAEGTFVLFIHPETAQGNNAKSLIKQHKKSKQQLREG